MACHLASSEVHLGLKLPSVLTQGRELTLKTTLSAHLESPISPPSPPKALHCLRQNPRYPAVVRPRCLHCPDASMQLRFRRSCHAPLPSQSLHQPPQPCHRSRRCLCPCQHSPFCGVWSYCLLQLLDGPGESQLVGSGLQRALQPPGLTFWRTRGMLMIPKPPSASQSCPLHWGRIGPRRCRGGSQGSGRRNHHRH